MADWLLKYKYLKGLLKFNYPVVAVQCSGMLHWAACYMVIDVSGEPAAWILIVLRTESQRSGFRIPAGARYFILLRNVQTDSEAYTALYSVGTWGFSDGIKQPGHMASQLLLSNAEVKNEWSYTFVACIRKTLPTMFYHSSVHFYHTTRRHFPENGNPWLPPRKPHISRNSVWNLSYCCSHYFQASAAMLVRSSLFWGVTQRRVVIHYWCFGAT
jgi:hypothetical protein